MVVLPTPSVVMGYNKYQLNEWASMGERAALCWGPWRSSGRGQTWHLLLAAVDLPFLLWRKCKHSFPVFVCEIQFILQRQERCLRWLTLEYSVLQEIAIPPNLPLSLPSSSREYLKYDRAFLLLELQPQPTPILLHPNQGWAASVRAALTSCPPPLSLQIHPPPPGPLFPAHCLSAVLY